MAGRMIDAFEDRFVDRKLIADGLKVLQSELPCRLVHAQNSPQDESCFVTPSPTATQVAVIIGFAWDEDPHGWVPMVYSRGA